ncbi:MAG: HAD-IIA family hydrolase [Phycisphaerales bacterium]|nr:HAD-IIA family hydrolase [Phycisphaerales bacterium]
MPIDLSHYEAVLLDLDGTIYHEDHALPGAIDLIRRLQKRGQKYACLSNSTNSPQRLADRLKTMGADVQLDHIYTATRALADYVLTMTAPQRRPRIFNLSTEGMHELLDGAVDWVESADQPCDAIVVGSPVSHYAGEDRQRIALLLARQGARVMGFPDRVYPSPRGLEFGSGALTHMLAYAAGVTPILLGKPQATFFNALCQKLGVNPARCVLIGDNLETDILGAKNVGMSTILTLTGITQRSHLSSVGANHQPDHVIDDLTQL